VFVSAQFGQGWVVAAVAPVGAVVAALELEGLPESEVEDGTIGAPHVSQ
jgi:hypothetical protein